MMFLALELFGVLVLSTLSVNVIRHYARRHLLDIPNQRSSHRQPTPTGGGLGMVLVFYLFIFAGYAYGSIGKLTAGILSTAVPVAVIGFWDDHQDIPARWRFVTHIGAAVAAVMLLPGGALLSVVGIEFNLGIFATAASVLFLVWLLNLFNFMDGTDGLAASEAVFVALALAGFIYHVNVVLAVVSAALAAAGLGFLIWNRPPAKIFMGDVGSGFLGFILGLLILLASHQQAIFIILGVILFAAFISDASLTLAVRFFSGKKWYQAHCSHAYQHAAGQYGHLRVMQVLWGINLCWLLPVAYCVFKNPGFAWLGLIAAYLPLLWLARYFRAGKE